MSQTSGSLSNPSNRFLTQIAYDLNFSSGEDACGAEGKIKVFVTITQMQSSVFPGHLKFATYTLLLHYAKDEEHMWRSL